MFCKGGDYSPLFCLVVFFASIYTVIIFIFYMFVCMQLFLTDFVHKDMSVIIENSVMLDQLKKVLRVKKGDTVAVQKKVVGDGHSIVMQRYIVRVDDWDHQRVYGTVVETIDKPNNLAPSITMYIAMPNKRDKAELIAQKLAEL